MSREIKFRAWDLFRKKMCYGNNYALLFNSSEVVEWKCQINFIGQLVPMQYTGLKDKNGKEIYEGDVVQESLWIDGNFITNCIKVFTVIYQGVSFQYQPIVKSNHTVNPIGTTVEIIGNIYENPELLNKENFNAI